MLSPIRMIGAAMLAVALPLSATACGGGDGSTAGGKIVIGTKFDQPGLGVKNPDGSMSGFDVDVARYVAKVHVIGIVVWTTMLSIDYALT